jgi:hypothetical protein
MKVDEMVSEAERLSREKYPDDSTSRLAFKCGMLQGYLTRMDAEIETLKLLQKVDEEEILNLQRELIEKDN